MTIRVLIAAAYASVRAGLQALLEAHEKYEVVGQASSPTELEALLAERPDVVLLDLPESDEDEGSAGGLERALELLSQSEAATVLIGDSAADFELLLACPLRGWAWLSRQADGAEIAAAVRAAAAGLAAFDRSRLDLLLANRHEPGPTQTRGQSRDLDSAGTAGQAAQLTAREREVLQLLALWMPNKSIARRLGISPHTAKFHVASILSKLGASSRAEAVALGARGGYLML